jgi:hypothetical protein
LLLCKQQKYGAQRFRQLNLVLQRVVQLQNEASRVLSDLPAYIKQVAAKNAPKAAASS